MLLSIFIYTYKDYINKITIISTRLRLYQQDYDYINKITIISTRLRLYQQDYDYINKITIISTRLRLHQQDYDNHVAINKFYTLQLQHYHTWLQTLDHNYWITGSRWYSYYITIIKLQVTDEIVIILQLPSYIQAIDDTVIILQLPSYYLSITKLQVIEDTVIIIQLPIKL